MAVRTLEDIQTERTLSLKEVEEEERLLRESVESKMALLLATLDKAEIVETLYRYAWGRLVLESPEEKFS